MRGATQSFHSPIHQTTAGASKDGKVKDGKVISLTTRRYGRVATILVEPLSGAFCRGLIRWTFVYEGAARQVFGACACCRSLHESPEPTVNNNEWKVLVSIAASGGRKDARIWEAWGIRVAEKDNRPCQLQRCTPCSIRSTLDPSFYQIRN